MPKFKKRLTKDYSRVSHNSNSNQYKSKSTKSKHFLYKGRKTDKTNHRESNIDKRNSEKCKSEVNQYWQILTSLKTFLQQQMNNFQAGHVHYKISEWEKLNSDKEILQNVKGPKFPFYIQPEMKPNYNFQKLSGQ